MEWTGQALLIGVRRHGETSLIAEAMVAGRGRCLGLVRGGRSSKLAPALQVGNTIQLTWRARLEDHLGTFTVELMQSRAADLMADRSKLYLTQLVCDHLRLLPERDPHDRLLGEALSLIDNPPDGPALARFELALLDELGFGLDLFSCAATGATTDLTHVSPKTGRAVSRAAAAPISIVCCRSPVSSTNVAMPPRRHPRRLQADRPFPRSPHLVRAPDRPSIRPRSVDRYPQQRPLT